jgi:hypothetical protein
MFRCKPMKISHSIGALALLWTLHLIPQGGAPLAAQSLPQSETRVHYTGTTLADPTRHDGALSPIVGVHNLQILRANRERPSAVNGGGWTYNHQPMLCYWQGRFYLHYLSDPAEEHVPPSRTLLMSSADGYHWSAPQELFPPLTVPQGYSKPGKEPPSDELYAVMHQRMGFYVSQQGRLLALGNYGVALDRKDDPNDGHGIGRVVREIYADGSFGPIYFIYHNHDTQHLKLPYPDYTKSRDRGFVRACRELLASPRCRMQWVEEADRGDTLIPLSNPYKAYCDYTLPDGSLVALWKHALTSRSYDGGNTWSVPVARAQGFVNSNAKIWGQRLSDGTYATVYNPAEFRWPLALSLSADGLEYTTLNLVQGDVSPMRYGGQYKSYGPQYVRGITEGNGTPPDGDLWVAYSMNKEDLWVAHIPVPIRTAVTAHAHDDFAAYARLEELREWNLNSLQWAPITLDGMWLSLHDSDPYEAACAERIIPPTRALTLSFDLQAEQAGQGTLQLELLDAHGTAATRFEWTDEGRLRVKSGARYSNLGSYKAGQVYHIEIHLSADNRMVQCYVDGVKKGQAMLMAPVQAVERLRFRTGAPHAEPTIDTPADRYDDLPQAGDSVPEACFRIARLNTASGDVDADASLLHYADFAHYAERFNAMEPEGIVQAIPDAEASVWMAENIPLFECPQRDFEEMYYFRWWSYRKHLRQTPVGYAMTEFLVERSYADRYNLISCALGHHLYEGRWLRRPEYMDQVLRTWLRGNDGAPMAKLDNYSSWLPDAVWNLYLVQGDTAALLDLRPDLCADYARWQQQHRLPSGLYGQADVQDGMEESISGGRKKRYARPSINSYMYGNARALAAMSRLAGDTLASRQYDAQADSLKQLVQQRLWNEEHSFFETLRGDSSAAVREAIGFLPWYFDLPDDEARYSVAWRQLADPQGFSAPFGLTTAERRHPAFRSHGVGRCEWDGAVWPFATSQTLTALARFYHHYTTAAGADSLFYPQMERYVEAQHYRGRPYIGEYLDEQTGYWLKGDQERSRFYNHSTFCDLIISGLLGLTPRADRTVEVAPLLPEDRWRWFCLDKVAYHGHTLTLFWDADGSHYHQGRGLHLLVDGCEVGHAEHLQRLLCPDVLH